jgi:fructosamine-3-kinase
VIDPALAAAIERATGERPVALGSLSGGCIAESYRVRLESGGSVVAKLGKEGSGLAAEGGMLRYLGEQGLPVPDVLEATDEFLVMTWIEGSDPLDARAEAHAAELLAALHSLSAERFGFHIEPMMAGARVPNPWQERWVPFYRDHRLIHAARGAHRAGRLPAGVMRRIDKLAGRIEDWLDEPQAPALIHGDMWGGNILCRSGRVVGFVDPLCVFAHPEMELAFSTLFSTFAEPFFRRYAEIGALAPGFFEERCDLYNLYHLLVHVHLFGAGYMGGVERTLRRYGV